MCERRKVDWGGGEKSLARALTFFSWGSGAGGKKSFFSLGLVGHVRPRARDFCKTVGKVEKLP